MIKELQLKKSIFMERFLILFFLIFLFICKYEQIFCEEKNLPKPGKSKKIRICLGKGIGIYQLRR